MYFKLTGLYLLKFSRILPGIHLKDGLLALVNTELEHLTTTIIDALDLACPLWPLRASAPCSQSWSDGLEVLHRCLIMLHIQLCQYSSNDHYVVYQKVERNFKRQLEF
jgi:hypothetical protein